MQNRDLTLQMYIFRMGFLKTERSKIIFTALVGMQIPSIALIYYLWICNTFFAKDIYWGFNLDSLLMAIFVFWVDAICVIVVTYILRRLLTPIVITSNTLNQYIENNRLNSLSVEVIPDAATLIVDNKATLQKLEGIVSHLVNYDSLTGLPNRRLFQIYVDRAITKTKEEQQFALIALDLNSLKNINSTLGRQVGDLLLTKVAHRLSQYLMPKDTLARFGGDEFVVLRTDVTDSNSSIVLANELLASLSQPFLLHGRKVYCDAKIGITIYPFDGITVEQLLQNADTAIHQAKQQQLNSYQFYSPVTADQLQRTLKIAENLRSALKNQEFSLYYQPRININTNRLVGVEALLRWYNPELGWVSPTEFIPIAEETNLIIPIGEWVLHKACLQNKQWQDLQSPLRVSVNLSTCQFRQANLINTVDRILKDTSLKGTCLELEITEGMLVEDMERTVAVLWSLRQKGISIALDDFGTGYSSLSYLQKLPLDTIKIDRSFVTNLAGYDDGLAIAQAIIALAQILKLNITAEGVETQEQFEYLSAQGCNEIQGYYFAKPLPPEALEDFLGSYNSKH